MPPSLLDTFVFICRGSHCPINIHHHLVSGAKTNHTQPTGIDWNNLVENVFREEISNFARDLNSQPKDNKK